MTGFFSRAKQKVIGATSSVLAAPSVLRSQNKQAKANMEADAMQLARKTSHVDLTGKDYRDPIFRARATAAAVMADHQPKKAAVKGGNY